MAGSAASRSSLYFGNDADVDVGLTIFDTDGHLAGSSLNDCSWLYSAGDGSLLTLRVDGSCGVGPYALSASCFSEDLFLECGQDVMATFEAYYSHYCSYFYTQIVSYHFNAQVGNFVVFSTCGDGDYYNTTISDEDGTTAFVAQCSWSSPSSIFSTLDKLHC